MSHYEHLAARRITRVPEPPQLRDEPRHVLRQPAVHPSPTTDLSPVIATFLFRRTEEVSVDQATPIMPTFRDS